ncbi:unnamed protein product [Brassica napus]|uniref:(rape) hypothetical protein n=1 Tax=Brassica napus TaxID=3708 RepID=A0A816U1T5_BRANA|nr:unnamed protein product [Brassica napus]
MLHEVSGRVCRVDGESQRVDGHVCLVDARLRLWVDWALGPFVSVLLRPSCGLLVFFLCFRLRPSTLIKDGKKKCKSS